MPAGRAVSGTVNISRGIWFDAAFKGQPFTEREAFMWMIMEASYKAREKRVGTATISLQRGQLAASIRFMAEAWNWQKSTVDRFLKRLENRDMIGTASGTGISVITICKYNDYQSAPRDSGTGDFEKRDSSGTAAGQQRDKPNKGARMEQEGSNVFDASEATASPKKQRRRCRLPEGWIPSPRNIEDAYSQQFTDGEIENEGRKFRDYHHAKGTTFADWDAGWRTWVSNARKFAGDAGNSRVGSGTAAAFAAVAARHAGRTQ